MVEEVRDLLLWGFQEFIAITIPGKRSRRHVNCDAKSEDGGELGLDLSRLRSGAKLRVRLKLGAS